MFKRLISKFRHFKASMQFKNAVEMADREHLKHGQRFYVMPGADGKLVIVDRYNFRKLRQKHYIDQSQKMADAQASCFYYTPYRNGGSPIPDDVRKSKEAMFYEFVEYSQMMRKYKKRKSKNKKS